MACNAAANCSLSRCICARPSQESDEMRRKRRRQMCENRRRRRREKARANSRFCEAEAQNFVSKFLHNRARTWHGHSLHYPRKHGEFNGSNGLFSVPAKSVEWSETLLQELLSEIPELSSFGSQGTALGKQLLAYPDPRLLPFFAP